MKTRRLKRRTEFRRPSLLSGGGEGMSLEWGFKKKRKEEKRRSNEEGEKGAVQGGRQRGVCSSEMNGWAD